MAKRKYFVELTCEVEIDDEVIAAVDDDWRKHFYKLDEPEDVVSHVAYNLLVNGARLSQLDGWADKSDDMAEVLRSTVDISACEA